VFCKALILSIVTVFILGCQQSSVAANGHTPNQLSVRDQGLLLELLELDFTAEEFAVNGPGRRKLKLVGRRKSKVADIIQRAENPRLVSILLTIALGPFGAHRLYLGTHIRVPILYTLTLGGGLGILPAIDLIMLIIQKDLFRFRDNEKVFMWS
jgi:TM2 domain-containing membrane protein YozV